jgi:hypothetical protein
MRAFLGQPQCHPLTDPLTGAGDNRNFSLMPIRDDAHTDHPL